MTWPVNLDRPPLDMSGSSSADWIELLCLMDVDGEISSDRVSELLSPPDDDGPSPEGRDRNSAHAADAFVHLKNRAALLGELYPFSVRESHERRMLRSHVDLDNADHHAYLLCLMASTLRYAGPAQSYIAREFEVLAGEAVRAYLPEPFEVHLFGTSTKSGDRYHGKLSDKLRRLAVDLSEEIGTRVDEIPDRNTGDRGIDVVAWGDPLDDIAPRLTVFAQAAATSDWTAKQYSASFQHLVPDSIILSVPNVSICLIPFYFRQIGGEWSDGAQIGQVVLLDRLRICRLLHERGDAALVREIGKDLVPGESWAVPLASNP
jgi:hypothetical protein